MVILVTGKAGAGKTTYAKQYAKELMADKISVVLLDSDRIRHVDGNKDFSDVGRQKHLERLARVASVSEEAGAVVVIAAICPKREWREMMRAHWNCSRLVYLPGGTMWPGTAYEKPSDDEY